MYYGYNDGKELILADDAFIELLGFNSFTELRTSNIMDNLKFEDKQIIIRQNTQTITSDFLHHEIYGIQEEFYLVELQNIQIEQNLSSTDDISHQAIYLDVHKISEEIGLSVDDYILYLDSFIDQSIIDEKHLLEGDDKVVENLSTLALTLKIPHINILLLKIQKLPHHERRPLIDKYYTKLALLTLEKPEDNKNEKLNDIFEEDKNEAEEELLNVEFSDLFQNIDKDQDNNQEPIPHTPIKKMTLDNAPKLPISYNPQTAANELNLPVVLVEEFVHDFIEQAHQDKDHLLTSYYQHDMDNIHELGHKLKGAASNLRINELSDVLEEIQFCADYSKLESLFIQYWGYFLSLEEHMQQLKRA